MRMIIRGFIQIYLKVVEWTAFEHYRKWRGTYILVAASPRRRLPMNASKLHEKRMVWVVFFTPFPEELPLWCKGCKKPAALARIHRGKEGKRSHGFYLAKHYWNCASARNLGWAGLYIYLFFRMLKQNEEREAQYQSTIDKLSGNIQSGIENIQNRLNDLEEKMSDKPEKNQK